MEQSTRDTVLDYMRQKYGDFRTSPQSASYPRLLADISYYLHTHFPQQYSTPAQAQKDAREIVNEVCVEGNKFRGGGGTRGNVNAGWMNVEGRWEALRKGCNLGY